MYSSKPLSQVVSIITNEELADWLGVDATDSLLPIMASSATSSVIEYVQHELINRQREVIYQQWPYIGTITGESLSRSNASLVDVIELPYSLNVVVDEVSLYDEITADFSIQDLKPNRIKLDYVSVITDSDFPAIKVKYTSGYGVITDVPDAIKVGALMLAAYMYEHRGECDADQLIKQSGAASYLEPYRFNSVVM